MSQLGQKLCHFSKTICTHTTSFLTALDACSEHSSGHKAVKFGRNYNGTTVSQKSFSSETTGFEMPTFYVDSVVPYWLYILALILSVSNNTLLETEVGQD
jgi:hypothetical protein